MTKNIGRDERPIITLYGVAASSDAYEIRDFLNRSVVEFRWVELRDDAQARRAVGVDGLHDSRLPVCTFPDGSRVESATARRVADELGWLTEPKHAEYDLSIYGAGPAGLSAAVYAASEGLRVVLIEREAVGGQAGTSSLIENYMGFPGGVSGADLAERARQQAVAFGAEILLMREGVRAVFKEGNIHADLADGRTMVAKTNICATGIEYRRLGLEDEEKYLNAGLYYGAGASEASLCSDEHVYVVGAGNSAGQAAMHFSDHARQVTMLVRGGALADSLSSYLLDKIRAAGNIEVRTRARAIALHGESCLSSITVADRDGERRADTKWLFVCIGGQPNTDWAKDTKILRDRADYLLTGPDLLQSGDPPKCWPLDRDPFYLETSVPGSFAAGDVRHGSVKRVASAVGEGAMAVQFVHRHLEMLRGGG